MVVEEVDFYSAGQLLAGRVAHDHRMVHKLPVFIILVEVRFGHGEADFDGIVLHNRREFAAVRTNFVADRHDQFTDAPCNRRIDFRIGKIVFAKLYGRFHFRDLRLKRCTVLHINCKLRIGNDFLVNQRLVAVVFLHGVVVFGLDLLQSGLSSLQFRLVDGVFNLKQQIALQYNRAFAESRFPQRAINFRRDIHRLGRPHIADIASRLGFHHSRAASRHDHRGGTLHLGLRRQRKHADRNHY